MINFLRLHPFQTAIRARQETNFPASLNTIRRRIKKSELNNRCAANKIFLTAQNKQQRVMFAQEYIHRNIWDAVDFSDEKTFQSSNSGRLRVIDLLGQDIMKNTFTPPIEVDDLQSTYGDASALGAQEFVQLWRRG
jgi:hypothetical protein